MRSRSPAASARIGSPQAGAAPTFDPRKPRYMTLAEELTAAIRDGTFPVGTLLPPEPALCATHDVSRHTLREAVRLLRGLGLVRPRQGHGTVVEAAQAPSRYVLSVEAVPDLWQYAEASALEVVGRTTIAASAALVPLPGVDPRSSWCEVEALRRTDDGRPLAWKHVYIDARYRDAIAAIGRRRVPIYSIIESRFGLRTARIRQQFGAEPVPAAAAKALGMKRGAAGFWIVREYYDEAGQAFEVTLTIYPPGRSQHRFDLVLAEGAA